MVRLADELDAPFSKYPYRWDALAVSSLTTAMLAQIEGGPPSIMVALIISKGRRSGHNQPQPWVENTRDSTLFGRWVAQQISQRFNFRFLILIGSHVCRTFSTLRFPIYVRSNFWSEREKGMRNPFLHEMRQEFNYGDIELLCWFVRRFYKESNCERPF